MFMAFSLLGKPWLRTCFLQIEIGHETVNHALCYLLLFVFIYSEDKRKRRLGNSWKAVRLYSGRKTRVFQDPCSSDGEIPATAVENPTA